MNILAASRWVPGSKDGRVWVFGSPLKASVFRAKNDKHWCAWDGVRTLVGFDSSQEAARWALRVEG